MSRVRKSGVSARMLVLGLLMESPDTPSGVAARLKERFASARLAQSNAHNVIKRMQREGLVSIVEGDEGRPAARIEATEAGAIQFEGWMRATWNKVPELRDPTAMRLAMCRDLRDLRMMSDAIAREEELCDDAHLDARTKAHVKQERLLRAGESSYEWRTAVEYLLLIDEAAFWAHRARRLHRIHDELHVIAGKIEKRDEA